MRLKTSARWKKAAARLKKLPAWAKGTIEIALIAVIALAILMVARQPSSADLQKTPAAAVKTAGASLGPVSYTTPGNMAVEGSASKASAAQKAAPVTITGCLERDDETFRLKDTAGVNAPTSRSWKSGFLKKKSASIDVVDAAHRLKLTDHVGQRVSVTGVLVDREMQVRSLQRVASTCANNSRAKNSN